MPFYYSTKQLPSLAKFSLRERREILILAERKLTAPEKLVLNLIKLLLLVPPFLFLAKHQNMWFFISIVTLLVGYYTIMRPINLFFCQKYLDKAIAAYQLKE